MGKNIVASLRSLVKQEVKSCPIDFGCITPEYVYRMWGGMVVIEEIQEAMRRIKG